MLGAIFLDIDHFKKINDTYGHAIGDHVLQKFVQIAKQTIRTEDVLIRWGGEEFLILLSVQSIDDLISKAEQLRQTISLNEFDTVKTVTASLGIAVYKENESFDTFVARADSALYKAKKQGRNCVQLAP